jgi:hypothetical protein
MPRESPHEHRLAIPVIQAPSQTSNTHTQTGLAATTTMTVTQFTASSPDTNLAQLKSIMAAQQLSDFPPALSVPVASRMNPSEEDLPPFPEPEISSIQLEHKPGAKMHYTYYPASTSRNSASNPFSQTLIVYLNGLMLPRSSWDASVQSFLEKRIVGRLPYPGLLSYDRYGQGDSRPQTTDPTNLARSPQH